MFLTESQKHYYTAMKKLGRKKPQKVIKRPRNQFLAMFYDLSNSRRFEIAIFVLIFLNMLTMGIEHYDQPHSVFFILEVSNAFFTTVFGLGKHTLQIIYPAYSKIHLYSFYFNNGYYVDDILISQKYIFFFRGDSKNYRSTVSLLHGAMERVRLLAGASLNSRDPHGRHYDRPAHIPNATPGGPSISNRENFKTD